MDMLADHHSLATIATADLDRARAFYEQTLGFKPTREMPELGVVAYEADNGSVLLYASEFASTNKATALSFDVPTDAFDAEITTLRQAGVNFETYELPGTTWDDGVAHMGGQRAAWFKDPDGNIVSLTTGMIE
jgi:catechol 2,3-dioxygenase-like lactoylglutathione lyase family enzyme